MERIRKVEHSFYSSKMKNDKKIILLSDLHYYSDMDEKKLLKLAKKIAEERPDYICISGDLIDDVDEICPLKKADKLINFMEILGDISPVMIGIGNHDITHFDNKKNQFKYYFNENFWGELNNINNINVLHNTSYQDDDLLISGYTLPFDYYYSKNEESQNIMKKDLSRLRDIVNVDSSRLNINLVHSPIYVTTKEIRHLFLNYDLVLSGHTHDGMLPSILCDIMPGHWGLMAPDGRPLPKIARGTKQFYDAELIISGGITKLSNCNGLISKLNFTYPSSFDVIDVTGNKDKLTPKKKIRYVK